LKILRGAKGFGLSTINMTHPEINLSWVSLFLRANQAGARGKTLNLPFISENRRSRLHLAQVQVSASNIRLGG
jgi:hypothetical protein